MPNQGSGSFHLENGCFYLFNA